MTADRDMYTRLCVISQVPKIKAVAEKAELQAEFLALQKQHKLEEEDLGLCQK